MRGCALWLMVLSLSLFTLGCQPAANEQPADQPTVTPPTTEAPAEPAAEPVEEPAKKPAMNENAGEKLPPLPKEEKKADESIPVARPEEDLKANDKKADENKAEEKKADEKK